MTETERRYAARRELWRKASAGIDFAGKTVLDAGTGEGFCTRFLAERKPRRLVSITCLGDEIEPARQRLGEMATEVEFQVADLTSMPEVPPDGFDVVVGDFLMAAVSAYSPYREIECIAELRRVLKTGGRLVLTGWQVGPTPRNRLDAAIRRLFAFRGAVHQLIGTEAFREHPSQWIERRLSESDTPPERTVVEPDVHHDFGWFGSQIRNQLSEIEPPALRAALEMKLDELEVDIVDHPAFTSGFHFGDLYAVVGCKLGGAILLG